MKKNVKYMNANKTFSSRVCGAGVFRYNFFKSFK